MLVHVVLVAVMILSREPNPTRCRGCGGWITLHRLDTLGCTTCQILAVRS